MSRTKKYSGWHYLVEFHGADSLGNQRRLQAALRAAARRAGATLLELHSHHFGPGYGVAAVALLAESHISIHTWPERSYAAVDIFMCGESNEPEEALLELQRRLSPARTTVRRVRRGYGAAQTVVARQGLSR